MNVLVLIICILFAIIGIALNTLVIAHIFKPIKKVQITEIVLLIAVMATFITKKALLREIGVNDINSIITANVLFFAAIHDIKEHQVPVIIFPIYSAIGVILGFYTSGFSYVYTLFFTGIVFLFLFLCSKKSNGKIGMGDSYAIAGTSLYYIPSITMGIVIISMFIALITAVFVAIRNKSGMSTTIPYIPLLWIALLIVLYIG